MKMIFERLIPGVQNRDDAQRSAQSALAKLQERFTDGFKQQSKENLFVGEDQAVEFMRQSEDQMEVSHRQKLGGLLVKPFGLSQGLRLGAVGVNGRSRC